MDKESNKDTFAIWDLLERKEAGSGYLQYSPEGLRPFLYFLEDHRSHLPSANVSMQTFNVANLRDVVSEDFQFSSSLVVLTPRLIKLASCVMNLE